MVILSLLFILQLIVGSVCIALSYHVQSNILLIAWNRLNNETKDQIETSNNCCGFKNVTERINEKNCKSTVPCFEIMESSLKKGLRLSGALSLVFSFLQVSLQTVYV